MNLTLEQMKNVNIRSVNPADLADLSDVKINLRIPRDERLKDFIRQIKNPYCYKVGNIVIKVKFSDDGTTLENIFKQICMKA